MQHNGFSFRIPEGIETPDGYVRIPHDTQYTVELSNTTDRLVDVEVSIDGKSLSHPLRLGNTIWDRTLPLQRDPGADYGRFTAFARDTPEFQQAGLGAVSRDEQGLITVTFYPAKPTPPAM